MNIIFVLIFLVMVAGVSATNFGAGDFNATCVEVKQTVLTESGWDQIYCPDNETTELIFIQGDFNYAHHPNSNEPNEVPEFGVTAALALLGAALIFIKYKD